MGREVVRMWEELEEGEHVIKFYCIKNFKNLK